MFVTANPPDVRFVGADGESLEGSEGAKYLHLPMWTVVALGPALGGFFLISFPLLVIGALMVALSRNIAGKLADQHAWVARAGYQPVAAYFTGTDSPEASEVDNGLEDLEAEVRERAAREKQEG